MCPATPQIANAGRGLPLPVCLCRYVRSHLMEYIGFGSVCQLLAMVPILNLFTLFTNCVGAALWVADLELDGKGLCCRY